MSKQSQWRALKTMYIVHEAFDLENFWKLPTCLLLTKFLMHLLSIHQKFLELELISNESRALEITLKIHVPFLEVKDQERKLAQESNFRGKNTYLRTWHAIIPSKESVNLWIQININNNQVESINNFVYSFSCIYK